jgi:DNA uptake protein ComE-like DNA-binding protein
VPRLLILALLCLSLLACSNSQNTEKTRQQAADAAAQLKQDSKQAATELKKGAEEARRQGTAIAQGVREGWSRDGSNKVVNVNSASEADLLTLPGFTRKKAAAVIQNRPYKDKRDLVMRGVISQTDYSRISSRITAD